MHSIFPEQSQFSHEAASCVSAFPGFLHASFTAIAIALAAGAAVGICLPAICEALAVATLRCLGDAPDSRSPGLRNRLLMMILCATVCSLCTATFGPSQKGLAVLTMSGGLLVGSVIDVRYRLLPDIVTAPLLWLGLLVNTRALFVPLPDAVLGAVAGYLGLRGISCIASFATRSEGIGHGDFKLLAALGAWLGWAALPLVLVIAALSSIVWSQAFARGNRSLLRESMAFGPFLALGGIVGVYLSAPGAYVLVR